MSRDPYARRYWVLAAVGAGTFLNVLDNAMLNVALPTIARELESDVGTVQWVALGYLLVISSLLLTGGRLGDMYGRKRMYQGGMLLFAAASVMAGFSGDVYQLIAWRVLQGVGSAMVQGIGPAITTVAFPASERGRALGINATLVALGGISGPVLGGLIADQLGWRWIFFLRIPLAVAVLGLTQRLLPDDRPTGPARRFDVAGAGVFFVALSSLLLGLNQGRIWGWGSPLIVGLFAAAAALFLLFVRVELTVREPMLRLGVFRSRLFATASGSALLNFSAASHSFFLVPFLLIQGLGYGTGQAGLLMVASMAAMSVAAPVSGALSDRFGSRVLSPIGAAMTALGLFSLSWVTPASGSLDVVWRLGLVGLGLGTFNSPNNSAMMGAVPRDQVGMAAGIMASVRNLGNAVGIAVAATLLTNREVVHRAELAAGGLAGPALEAGALVAGIQDAFRVAAAIAVVGLSVALIRGRAARPTPAEAAAPAGRTERPVGSTGGR